MPAHRKDSLSHTAAAVMASVVAAAATARCGGLKLVPPPIYGDFYTACEGESEKLKA